MTDLNWRDAIVAVLADADEPLHYAEIAKRVADQGLRRKLGATPAATVSREISDSLRTDGKRSQFERVGPGMYRIRGAASARLKRDDNDTDDDARGDTGLINAFGMYWRRDAVVWKSTPRLLGKQQPASTPVNFSDQRGVYLLHDRREVVYVGRTTDRALGLRLRDHTTDRLGGRWDRFSWFGVLSVDADGELASAPQASFGIENLIETMEALLIEGLEPPQNRKRGDGFSAVEFLQAEDPELERQRELELAEKLIDSLR